MWSLWWKLLCPVAEQTHTPTVVFTSKEYQDILGNPSGMTAQRMIKHIQQSPAPDIVISFSSPVYWSWPVHEGVKTAADTFHWAWKGRCIHECLEMTTHYHTLTPEERSFILSNYTHTPNNDTPVSSPIVRRRKRPRSLSIPPPDLFLYVSEAEEQDMTVTTFHGETEPHSAQSVQSMTDASSPDSSSLHKCPSPLTDGSSPPADALLSTLTNPRIAITADDDFELI